VIDEALQALRDRERASGKDASNGPHRGAVREMLVFVEKNHVRLEGLSLKELVREVHRL
jgi:hypothetical protein